MTKRHIPIVVALGALSIAMFSYVGTLFLGNSKGSDDSINSMFECNREMTEARATDVYCDNPELYRQHVQLNTIIQN